MNQSAFSIVIPAWNCKNQLERLLNQIADQDYPKEITEVLVIDDGSSDGTGELAKKMGATVISHDSNKGRVITRETGAKNAKYENLVFIDARCSIESTLLTNASKLDYLPLMGVGMSDKTLSIIDRVFYCIRRKVYSPYEPQTLYNKELWLKKDKFNGRPKGTGLLIIKREMFLDCALQEKYQDVNDDTKLLYNIVNKGAPILRHTDLPFFYEHRQNWSELLRHTFFRGPKFYDYYLAFKGPYFTYYFLFLLSLFSMTVLCFQSPVLLTYIVCFLLTVPCLVAIWMSEEIKDFFACLIFFPPVATAFISGIAFAQLTRLTRLRGLVKH